MKTLSKEEFVKTVRDGRLDKGMVSFLDQQDRSWTTSTICTPT